MRKLYDGKTMTLVAKVDVTKGKLIKIGAMVVLPAETKKAGERFTAIYDGIYGDLKIAQDVNPDFLGEKAYLKKDTHELTTTVGSNSFCGYFITTDGEQALMLKGI